MLKCCWCRFGLISHWRRVFAVSRLKNGGTSKRLSCKVDAVLGDGYPGILDTVPYMLDTVAHVCPRRYAKTVYRHRGVLGHSHTRWTIELDIQTRPSHIYATLLP